MGFGMFIGYARVSTLDQNLDLQIDALKNAGCGSTFHDIASGSASDRPGLAKALNYARSGDILVVWRLDRLGRSLAHLIELIEELGNRGIGFRAIQEGLDTSSSGGKLIFHVFGAISQFEKELIQERTRAGLESAKARGRLGGRPRKLTPSKIELAQKLSLQENLSVGQICEALGISKTTYHRCMKGNYVQGKNGSANHHLDGNRVCAGLQGASTPYGSSGQGLGQRITAAGL